MAIHDRDETLTSARGADAASVRDALESFLADTRRELDSQIRDYPTPIPRCDAQFNHLYAQRVRVMRALDALRSAGTAHDALEAVAGELLQHPAYGDSEAERSLRSRLRSWSAT